MSLTNARHLPSDSAPETPTVNNLVNGGGSSISVVMCTYNGERFVARQLETILNQTMAPAEIIVSDDGSTDATIRIVSSVAQHTRIPIRIYQNKERLGFAENFLRACEYAQGSYISFSDQDDRWHPTKLESGLHSLRANNAVLCVHSVERIDANDLVKSRDRSWFPRTRVVAPLQSHPWGNFLGFTMLFDRTLLDKIPRDLRGEDPHTHHAMLSHDRWIFFLASTFGRTVILPECLAAYRQHQSQLYGGTKKRSLKERIATKLSTGEVQARYLAGVAAYRASILESMSPAAHSELWQAGAGRWRTTESHILNSAGLYKSCTARERARLLMVNLSGGTYRSFRKGGLGFRRFVEDCFVAALTSSRLREARTGSDV